MLGRKARTIHIDDNLSDPVHSAIFIKDSSSNIRYQSQPVVVPAVVAKIPVVQNVGIITGSNNGHNGYH